MANVNQILDVKGDRESIEGAIHKNRTVAFTNHVLVLSKNSLRYLSTDRFINQHATNRSKFGIQKECQITHHVSN
jgi:hypothetical protein